MLNTNTHRVTDLEDVEAHINGNHVPRWLNTRAEVRQFERDRNDACNGNCVQGRMCDCVPDIGANDTKDAGSQMPEGGLIALLFVMAVACIGVLAFIVSIARSAQ